jgi:hypothetical protein
MPKTKWGKWKYRSDNLTLEYEEKPGRPTYPIDLEELTDPAKTLDMIMQVTNKVWATTADLGNLTRALNDLLAPQATLCSFGSAKRIRSVRKVLQSRGYPVT